MKSSFLIFYFFFICQFTESMSTCCFLMCTWIIMIRSDNLSFDVLQRSSVFQFFLQWRVTSSIIKPKSLFFSFEIVKLPFRFEKFFLHLICPLFLREITGPSTSGYDLQESRNKRRKKRVRKDAKRKWSK